MKPILLLSLSGAAHLFAADLQFEHHFIDDDLPGTRSGAGGYGLSALVDIDRDGSLDFVFGGRSAAPPRLYWFEHVSPGEWEKHIAGTNYLSDAGLAALDVDEDGWSDLVCSGVWFRNPGAPKEQPFERLVFDPNAAGAHDVAAADLDGDGRKDIVMMGDERTQLNSLRWYSIPKGGRGEWQGHHIAPPVHGAITPGGIGDLDGDGDLDIVRAGTWYENQDGKALEWAAHENIPMGRSGPYGICVRAGLHDFDGDGDLDIAMTDADIVESKAVVLLNADGKGGAWEKIELPQSFRYGSLHSFALADFDGDGLMDIVSNEQEELLPDGRRNPRWVIWRNLGGLKFAETIILDRKLGGHELQAGDVDGDGDIDICSKVWGARKWNGNGGRLHADFLLNLSR